MKRNVASQLISAQMIATADGSDVTTGTCNVAVEKDGAAGTGGTATHIANGKWEYAPIQGDTDAEYLTFQFTLTNAITVTAQLYTAFPQTVDNDVLNQSNETLLLDIPTVSEFNARTQPTADYFDPAADTVVNVTNVATLTTYTGNTPQTADHTAAIADIPTVAEFNARTRLDADYFSWATDAVANVTLTATTTAVTDDVGITQAGADKVWDTTARILTASTNFNDVSVTDIWTTQLTEAYAADGVAGTGAQVLFLTQQILSERVVSGTTLTIAKLDGTTTAVTFTLDSATAPTDQTRAT